jgi:3-oxoacyl-[acyl-carrier-protein] synthase II
MVSPLAGSAEETWSRILAGRSGAARIESFEVSDLPCQIACQVKRGDGADGTWNADAWMEQKEQRKVDDFIIYAVSAATQALADAGWAPKTPDEQNSTGVLIGSGIGGLGGIYEAALVLKERGPRRLSPFFVPGVCCADCAPSV